MVETLASAVIRHGTIKMFGQQMDARQVASTIIGAVRHWVEQPGLSAIIAGLVAVHYAKGVGAIIGYAVYAAALRLSIDQLLGPIALGTAAMVHPVLIIFCFLTGGLLFGITRLILAVPVALLIKTTLGILYNEPVVSAQAGART